jgi:hypothetical protein
MDLRSGSGPNRILLPLICWRYPGATPSVKSAFSLSASSSHVGSNYIISRQWPPDPLQLELTHRLDLHGILDLRQHSRANEDLPRPGFIAEARGHVRHRPDGGIVKSALEADGAERGKAVRELNGNLGDDD